MPWSQTPVVSQILASNALRTAAFPQAQTGVGFLSQLTDYPNVHDYTYFGAQYTACTLAPSGFGLPLPGLPANVTTDLLAKLWSGGTFQNNGHPLGNNIEFQ